MRRGRASTGKSNETFEADNTPGRESFIIEIDYAVRFRECRSAPNRVITLINSSGTKNYKKVNNDCNYPYSMKLQTEYIHGP